MATTKTSQVMKLTLALAIAEKIDQFTDKVGRSAAWLSLIMVLVTLTIVVLRYAFQMGSIALQESIMYINALVFTLGAAYTLKEQGHVRVDIFYSKASPRAKALVDIVGACVFLFLTLGFIAWWSWDYVAVSWRIREGSTETSGLPFVYLLKSTIFLLIGLLALQGISELIKSVRDLVASKQ
ncbi:MAG: TRAP-type mannitol/chloroaromatic compound transport system permease small subunit [Pseudohongiellaceae bacterium]|jgi:TRAP-type mannitol/chloroaromatic compound transport system permease small subunit